MRKTSCMQVVVKASINIVHPKDPEAPPCGVDDMAKLAYLHEPGILKNLRSRYDINEIYVSISKYIYRLSLIKRS
jgi:myosin-5